MYRCLEDIEKINELDEERLKLLEANRKLNQKLEKRNNRIQELEERLEEFEDHQRRHQVDRFRDQYVKLEPLTQIRVLGFLAQTKHYQLNQLGESVFEGSREVFETALPVLQLLAPSIKHKNWCYLQHDHGDMTTCAGLRDPNQWSVEFTPNEIVFPEIKNHPISGWEMDMTPGSYSHPLGANYAINI